MQQDSWINFCDISANGADKTDSYAGKVCTSCSIIWYWQWCKIYFHCKFLFFMYVCVCVLHRKPVFIPVID